MFHMPVIILLIIVCLMRTGMNLQSPVVDRRTALSALQGALIKLNEFYKDDDSIKFAGLRASRKDRIAISGDFIRSDDEGFLRRS